MSNPQSNIHEILERHKRSVESLSGLSSFYPSNDPLGPLLDLLSESISSTFDDLYVACIRLDAAG